MKVQQLDNTIKRLGAIHEALTSRGGPNMNPGGRPYPRRRAVARVKHAMELCEHARRELAEVPDFVELSKPEATKPKKPADK